MAMTYHSEYKIFDFSIRNYITDLNKNCLKSKKRVEI